MAQRNLSVPSEDIIELYDVVDGVGASRTGIPGKTEPAAHISNREGGTSSEAIQGYCYENIDDFLEVLEKKPSCTLMPPKEAVPVETPAMDASAEAVAEPDAALVREFEAALAGAIHEELSVETQSAADAARPEDTVVSAAAVTAEDMDAPVPSALQEPAPDTVQLSSLDDEAPSDGGAVAEALSIADAEGEAVPDALEERFMRVEEALNSLSERVAALERHVADAEADFPERALHLETMLAEGRDLCVRLQTLAAGSTGRECRSSLSEQERPEPETFPQVAEDGPDMLALTVESLQERVSVLESRPQTPCVQDVSAIARDVLALVRVDMKAAAEENDVLMRALEALQQRVQVLEARPLPVEEPVTAQELEALNHRIQDLEAQVPSAEGSEALAQELELLKRRVTELEERPLPELILPELPDTERVTAEVLERIRGELDRVASESAARVLREEIVALMQSEE